MAMTLTHPSMLFAISVMVLGLANVFGWRSYADRKTMDLVDTDKEGFIEPWRECRQHYQHQVALNMANSLLSFVNENYLGSEIRKLGA